MIFVFKHLKKILLIIPILICLLLVGAGMIRQQSKEENILGTESQLLKKVDKPIEQQQQPSYHSLTPFHSNQWYTQVQNYFPTQPIFARPLVFKLSESGIGISYPEVVKNPKTIFGTYREDLVISLSSRFKKPSIDSISDWLIHLTLQAGESDSASFFMGQGFPFTVISVKGESFNIRVPHRYTLYEGNSLIPSLSKKITNDSIVITTQGRSYVLFTPKKSSIVVNGSTISIQNPEKVFIGLLDKRDSYNEFKKIRNIEVVSTAITPELSNNDLITAYSVLAKGGEPLIALFPHHIKNLGEKHEKIGEYKTILGTLSLVKTSSFMTKESGIAPPDTFQKLKNTPEDLIAAAKQDAAIVMSQKPPTRDYFLGVWYGKVSNVLIMLDMLGLETEKNQLLEAVKPVYLESLSYFEYDENKKSVIAKYPDFGNEHYNDHHFQYGYFIRAGAVLAKLDPSFKSEISQRVSLLVEDIANIDRENNSYPFIRNFNIYEGHSFADGYANFLDGANQESSSEAINAWYGLYLWAKVTENPQLMEYALFLYKTEIEATKQYWFGENALYTEPYAHKIASMVWGGKVDYATWFSPDTNMIYGIQLLPYTPASSYLGELSDFSRYETDYKRSGGDERKNWGDLFIMWKSFYKPDEALSQKNTPPISTDINSKSVYLYYLYYNKENHN